MLVTSLVNVPDATAFSGRGLAFSSLVFGGATGIEAGIGGAGASDAMREEGPN